MITKLHPSPSPLPEQDREVIVAELNARLADGLDLHSQIKVAHWNIKGPHFATLHPLFETFAIALAAFNDQVAERAITLGGIAHGTTRHVAKVSKLDEYPEGTTKDLVHVELLAARIEQYLAGVRASRKDAAARGDDDTEGLLTDIVSAFETHAWFLRATLGG